MKKLLLSVFVLVLAIGSINAQSMDAATMQQKKPHELTKLALLKLQSSLGIDNNQSAKCYSVFENYFKAKASIAETLLPTEVAEKEAQGGFNEIANKRDEQLQSVFSEKQFKKWKEISSEFMMAITLSK